MILNKQESNNSKKFLESVDSGSNSEIIVDKEIFVAIHQNETNVLQNFNKLVSKDFIQFHFCLKGSLYEPSLKTRSQLLFKRKL